MTVVTESRRLKRQFQNNFDTIDRFNDNIWLANRPVANNPPNTWNPGFENFNNQGNNQGNIQQAVDGELSGSEILLLIFGMKFLTTFQF